MKQVLALMIIALAMLAACAQPPEDVPRAEIADEPAEETEPDAETEELEVEETEEADLSDVEEVPADKEASSFEFVGYGPGKEHAGTFEEMDGSLFVKGGEIVGAKGVMQTASVSTGIGKLDEHVRTDDFLDVENFPEIIFEGMIADGIMTGTLDLHGVQEEVSFPVEVSESSVSADFLLDVTPFNLKYVGMNKDVRVQFTASK